MCPAEHRTERLLGLCLLSSISGADASDRTPLRRALSRCGDWVTRGGDLVTWDTDPGVAGVRRDVAVMDSTATRDRFRRQERHMGSQLTSRDT